MGESGKRMKTPTKGCLRKTELLALSKENKQTNPTIAYYSLLSRYKLQFAVTTSRSFSLLYLTQTDVT